MGRDASNEAKDQLGTANGYATTYGSTAAKALKPTMDYAQRQLSNPTGYTPSELGDMLTKSNESLGGSMSSAVGQGNLLAARNRNAAGYATAIDEAARNAMRQQSTNALNVSGENAGLEQQKQAQAAQALQSLYSGAMGGTLNALGVGNGSINAQTNADQATTGTWMPIVTSAISGASNFAKPK